LLPPFLLLLVSHPRSLEDVSPVIELWFLGSLSSLESSAVLVMLYLTVLR